MFLRQIFDPYLAQYAYLVGCQRSGEALIIDPERDIDRYKDLAEANGLRITAVAETHIHADFVSGAREFSADPNMQLYLSAEGGADWTYQWPEPGSRTHFLKHGDSFFVGKIRVEALHTPGHTPEHLSFLVTDLGGGADQPIALATGDFIFVGDVGRPDLLESAAGAKGVMEPSARRLRESLIWRLVSLPDFLQILPGHGAGSACGKALGAVPTSTLGYEKRFNRAIKLAESNGEAFVKNILSGQPEPPPYFATMKRVNRDGIEVRGSVTKAPELSSSQFVEAAKELGVRILDTRGENERFAGGHFEKAIHAPLKTPFFSSTAGSFFDENDPILLIVESAGDARIAMRQLYRIGFDRVLGWSTVVELADSGQLTHGSARIFFADFQADIVRNQGVILDVRTTSEFEKGHLEGALSIPYTRMKSRLAEVPKEQRLFVHCGSGRRASLAASYLVSLGYDAVHVDGVCAECERIAKTLGVAH